ncbi:protein involved in gliding motility SprA [Aequorivita sublithincola DSM 14238]|uniref:Protein involved in gliding motility SprA n=1 Tax=Aequorivita sublithincola (strain DSM 14238 / LMG 21431 / ACAM 643 / 9-3) TaxID=746697 RepID=I3YTS1_AEQSU|nr:cell surface protein SprA [Aequorivita sublithincola]AFL80389.1 protein involved in gliding motility SprA [Aequorivita sublithincola DSM 14238]
MKAKNYVYKGGFFKLLAILSFILVSNLSQAQDSTAVGNEMGRMDLPSPASIQDLYTYDPITDRYIYTKTLGSFKITYPIILTRQEYQRLIQEEQMKAYFKEKIDAADGRKDGAEEQQKNLLPTFYVNSSFFESVFGGDSIEVIPQGSVEIDLGMLYTKQDNPAFSPRNRSNFGFDFDMRISLSLLAKVGTRLQVTANYDTESTFDFQNQLKLEYTPTEDDIIQKIEVGNVSMPLNSSLIQGAQSLFGVKTQLQFGKTTITGVFSEQKSETRTVTAEGGATITDFELAALDYDENRHFFLSHYFRDNYDRALQQYPFINSNVQITRMEIWITNRSSRTDNVRNIVALQDIGESDPTNIGLSVPPGGFIRAGRNAYPDNENNLFNPFGIDGSEASLLNPAIRDVASVSQGFTGVSVNEGTDFVTLENARRLEGSEYTLNSQLGYISLNQRLTNDEVLAISYQFTVNGKVYQVGEFSNDGVEASGGTQTTTGGGGGTNPPPGPVSGLSQNLVVKLLKSSITNVKQPVWDLMMKNIYPIGAYQLEKEDFKMNIFYTEASPRNYIEPAPGGPELPDDVKNQILLKVFNLDRLDFNNDPVQGGDGFFDFLPGLTVDAQNGRIIFTSVEPFGKHLFDKLNVPSAPATYTIPTTYNANQAKYVFRTLYTGTKTEAEQQESEKNKFQLKGTYKSTGADGIPIGAFNIPQGSVTVKAGGRTLVEGVDYTVNYQLGRVQILDPGLLNSNIPITVSTENNSLFGQQSKRFTGLNVEHKFSDKFLIGATYLNLNERPITQKSSYGVEPINNTVYGINLNYATEVPFLTRMVNHLPNIDTDVESNISLRGEFAYLMPGAPKVSDFDGKTTVYVDDFEASQTGNDISTPSSWFLASTPTNFYDDKDPDKLSYNYKRAKLSWYTIDPIFYSSQRPEGINDEDLSSPFTRRVFRDEIFPEQDIIQGQTQALFTLDLSYYPTTRGEYNYNPAATSGTLPSPKDNFGGIMRPITTTDFEKSNVEYIQFWVMDPFIYDENNTNPGGTINFNLGSISEDILKDGRKQYENGLPKDGGDANTLPTEWGKVPLNQSLVYTFDSDGQERINQDIGLDGLSNAEEAAKYPGFGDDPANDDYQYFLQADGGILDRYLKYNGTQGNSPVEVTNNNRGSTAQPDVEDINRDNTMNTINSYFEYNVPVFPGMTKANNTYISDIKELDVTTQNNDVIPVRWVQFKVPISKPDAARGGISDYRSIRFMRMFLSKFSENTVLRFGTLELVRGDYRRFEKTLDDITFEDPANDDTLFEVEAVSIEENENRSPIPYVLPPGLRREEFNNNNNIIRENEQSLALRVCGLEPNDGRSVYKSFNVDMRQYKNLEMFIHAESLQNQTELANGDMYAFIRLGNDLTNNYYEIQIPLNPTNFGARTADEIWPLANRLNLPLELLQQVKTIVLGDRNLYDPTIVNYFNQSELDGGGSNGENELVIGIKGNPSFGNVRNIMLGVKNKTNNDICGEVWFNELRMSELKNKGGWAAVVSMDANIADFATISATGKRSTVGFGSIEQGPNQRSREDLKQYDVVTNLNLGQLMPKKWGVQLPFNYGRSEELITPQYDPEFQDIELESRLDNTDDQEEKDRIQEQSVNYTKRQSVNLIGVRKERTGDAKAKVYDVENLTASFSYNQTDHHDFEVEDALEQNVRLGATYNYNFTAKPVEPFKKNDSIFRSQYWKFLKDFNFNYLPTNIAVSSNITRQYNEQKFREINVDSNNIGLPRLYQRNYLFDWQYTINHNLTKALRFNFTSSNTMIVNNYVDDSGFVDNQIGVWDGFFDVGDPNQHFQSLQVNYDLPFSKFPFLKFVRATYSYTGDYQWQAGSKQFNELPITLADGTTDTYNLGNAIQNASTHQINSSIDMNGFYRYVGLTKIKKSKVRKSTDGTGNDKPSDKEEKEGREGKISPDKNSALSNGKEGSPNVMGRGAAAAGGLNAGDKAMNTLIGFATMLKKIQFNYQENNGIYLPGYLPSIGFIGTLKPTTGFVFGSQAEVRELAAKKGWLTIYPEFNEQYTEVESRQMDIQANLEPIKDLTIDVNGSRIYSENYAENYIIQDGLYNSLTPNTYGNFNISTVLIKTAFSASDEFSSAAFDDFRTNRLTIANRLAEDYYQGAAIPRDTLGYPVGFGRNSQDVLLPSFLAAYKGSNASKEKTGILRDIPLPNWDIKYTGLMNVPWFKKNFKRFSLTHGYRASYTVNQFQSNLDYDPTFPEATDQAGNFKVKTLLTNVNLTEQFSPLLRVDFEMNNSVKILAEMRKDRALSLSFANNLLTEIKGNEYIVGLGYRIKDLRVSTNFGGKKSVITSDLNFKVDLSRRDNITIIRYLDIMNNQTTAGQTIYGAQLSIDYALSKNLTALFYYDHSFSKYAISTAFPQTTIRSGFTLRYNFGN